MNKYLLAFFIYISMINLQAVTSDRDPLGIFSNGKWRSLKINIICQKNGVGLSKDYEILAKELIELGHQPYHVPVGNKELCTQADVNIFIEKFDLSLFHTAKKNCLLPNPEWYFNDVERIKDFDLILCRTHEVERIFKQHCGKTYYIGFTSCDRYRPKIEKNYKKCFHLRGQSPSKGSDAILSVWKTRQDFPRLVFISHGGNYSPLFNLDLHLSYMDEKNLTYLQNHCGIHLAPSETEGFGHYLSEGLSCGAVVITTNAPPMNEFVLNSKCLVDFYDVKTMSIASTYLVDPKKLERCLDTILSLPKKELKKIGNANRRLYLKNKKDFQNNLKRLFGSRAK